MPPQSHKGRGGILFKVMSEHQQKLIQDSLVPLQECASLLSILLVNLMLIPMNAPCCGLRSPQHGACRTSLVHHANLAFRSNPLSGHVCSLQQRHLFFALLFSTSFGVSRPSFPFLRILPPALAGVGILKRVQAVDKTYQY